eukprot:RCo008285
MSSKGSGGSGLQAVWVQTRHTVPGGFAKKAVFVPAGGITVDEFKASLAKHFEAVVGKAPVTALTVYYHNPSADDYIAMAGTTRVLENPLPELFADAPGTREEHPLYFDLLPQGASSSSSSQASKNVPAPSDGTVVWVQPRGTISLPDMGPRAVGVTHSGIIVNSFKAVLQQAYRPALDAVPASELTLYYYNRSADDYLPLSDGHGLDTNPLPEMFSEPPGRTAALPLFFDYIQKVGSVPGEASVWVQPRGTISLPDMGPRAVGVTHSGIIVNSFKAVLQQAYRPALDAVPASELTLYYYNRSADDYLPLSDGHGLDTNPLPEMFSEPPGRTAALPLFFDYIQ